MQYSVLAFVTLFAAVMASPAKRQAAAAAGQPTVQDAAMTNQAGDVVAFDTANVYLDSVAKGL
ncbi:hypothetical protein N0V93_008478 [Gnomoniopsis smithogilvyi]|uniref:Uncharacterized protein n=1 Tax=Gnomoniopsis smithogilvyi TaxID=1191159 RepID=A0A9W8YLS8_9PEZI|nr:hypothetical protein N0V93_008478 [Gnomoniopsis smithogilvyi]